MYTRSASSAGYEQVGVVTRKFSILGIVTIQKCLFENDRLENYAIK